MHTDALRAVDGLSVFPVVSLVLFVVVFTVMLVRTARIDRASLARHARLPIDETDEDTGCLKTPVSLGP